MNVAASFDESVAGLLELRGRCVRNHHSPGGTPESHAACGEGGPSCPSVIDSQRLDQNQIGLRLASYQSVVSWEAAWVAELWVGEEVETDYPVDQAMIEGM